MRVSICWMGISGYLAACWRELAARPGVDIRLAVFASITADMPFALDLLEGLPADRLDEQFMSDGTRVADVVAAHRPDIVVIPGWIVPAFASLTRDPRLKNVPFIMVMDNPRRSSGMANLRQWGARVRLRRLLRRMDRIIVPGERAWQYARFLGFSESQIRRGLYGINVAGFEQSYRQRLARPEGWPRRFLFAGRYAAAKGIDVLLEAYRQYRRTTPDPWPLTCCGGGPFKEQLRGEEGVEDLGFVQPADQPALWAECGAFVLASRYDPWPLVLAEACAAGLPVLCTEACGSSVELVLSNHNGLTVASEDPADLARGLRWIHDRYSLLPEMGAAGQQRAAGYSAQRWADRWVDMFQELIHSQRPAPSPRPGTARGSD